jgi:hypothetical protein
MLDDSFPPQIDSQLKLSDGLFYDLSGEGNTITNNGATLTADHRGRANKAFQNTAANDITINGSNLDFTNGLSCFIGLKSDTFATNRYFMERYVSPNQQFLFRLNPGGFQVYLSSTGNSISKLYAVTGITISSWNFIGFTYTNNILKLYHNGSELNPTKTADDAITTLFNSSADINLFGGTTGRIVASMDDIILTDRVLTDSEIKQLYNEWRK